MYFAIVTLALAMTLTVLIIGQQGDTGGANGITDFRTLLGMDIVGDEGKRALYLVEAACLTLCMLAALAVVRSRVGKILIAIRDREDRVRFSGYDTAHVKACVFSAAAVLSSIGGLLHLAGGLDLAGSHRRGGLDRDGDLRGGRRPAVDSGAVVARC